MAPSPRRGAVGVPTLPPLKVHDQVSVYPRPQKCRQGMLLISVVAVSHFPRMVHSMAAFNPRAAAEISATRPWNLSQTQLYADVEQQVTAEQQQQHVAAASTPMSTPHYSRGTNAHSSPTRPTKNGQQRKREKQEEEASVRPSESRHESRSLPHQPA